MIPAFLSAPANGAVVVTPNRRLARYLHETYDQSQRAAGRLVWPTPSILPYPAWLQQLWQCAIAADASLARTLLLSPPQSALLWRHVVGDDAPLLDARGAAKLAVDAWSTMHAWGAGGDSWRAWQRDSDAGEDTARFASWASAYAAELRRLRAIDIAQLPDVLASLPVGAPARSQATLFAGFIEITPQLERLRAALAARGVAISDVETVHTAVESAVRTTAATARAELASALTWARRGALEHPGKRIGIIVDALADKREEVLALADEILSPERTLSVSADAARPFEISLGVSLAEIPLVRTALDLIAIAASRSPSGEAAAMLRSPYLRGTDAEWGVRAEIEREWLQQGRREVTLLDAIAALERHSADLAAAWREGRDAMRRARPSSPRDWTDVWRAWLAAAGWPGSRPLDSGEFQARKAWDELLADFAALGAVAPRLAPASAFGRLLDLAQETLFQTEGSGARIQILGVLEGSGLAFDALWVAGLSADRWPPGPAPNPLLPLAWQRERNVARSSAQRELEYARALTGRFARAAPEVVFSSARVAGDRPQAPSALILPFPTSDVPAAAESWLLRAHRSASLESMTDDRAPPVDRDGVVPGGTRLVQSQSDCPFQAMARYRLRADPWPAPLLGLSPRERGSLVHASFAAFWAALREHAALLALDEPELAARIARAVESGIAQLLPTRWRGLPEVVRSGETYRLVGLLRSWLAVERKRPAFSVCAVETRTTLKLSGIAVHVRFDRVDALADEGVVILDYKTGRADPPSRWFDPRPRSAQLGMYTLAQRDAAPQVRVRAVAYANLCPDEVRPLGISADAEAWPALTPLETLHSFDDWSEVEAWWHARLGALAAEISAGCAAVTPRLKPLACDQCGLQPLCRIESVRMLDRFGADDE